MKNDRWTESTRFRTVNDMHTLMTPHRLDQLAFDIARDGIAAHEAAVTQVVRHASAFAAASQATTILADRTQPAVARERAFARVVAGVSRRRERDLTAA